jgi:hypothetical protein
MCGDRIGSRFFLNAYTLACCYITASAIRDWFLKNQSVQFSTEPCGHLFKIFFFPCLFNVETGLFCSAGHCWPRTLPCTWPNLLSWCWWFEAPNPWTLLHFLVSHHWQKMFTPLFCVPFPSSTTLVFVCFTVSWAIQASTFLQPVVILLSEASRQPSYDGTDWVKSILEWIGSYMAQNPLVESGQSSCSNHNHEMVFSVYLCQDVKETWYSLLILADLQYIHGL